MTGKVDFALRWTHAGPAWSVVAVATPEGPRLASGGADGVVRVWDPSNWAANPLSLITQGGPIFALATTSSEAGVHLVSGGYDGSLRVWSPRDWSAPPLKLRGHSGPVLSLIPISTPDGLRLASSSQDATVRIWDPDNMSESSAELRGHRGPVLSAAVVTDRGGATRLVTGGHDGAMRVWRPGAWTIDVVVQGHSGPVRSLAAVSTPKGLRLVSGGQDGFVKIWTPSDWTADPISLPGSEGPIWSLSASSSTEGSWLASGEDDGTIQIRDAAAWGVEPDVLVGHDGRVLALTEVPTANGPELVSGGDDGSIQVWNLKGQERIKALKGHNGPVRSLATVTTPSGDTQLASGGDDGNVRIWNPRSPRSLPVAFGGHDSKVLALAAMPTYQGGFRLASGGDDGTIRVWDPSAWTRNPLVLTGHEGSVSALTAVSTRRQQKLASGGQDGTVRVWDPSGPTANIAVLRGHDGPVLSLAEITGRDGDSRLASGGADGNIRVWDLSRSKPTSIATISLEGPVRALTAVKDEEGHLHLISGGDDELLRVWNPPDWYATPILVPAGTRGVLSLTSLKGNRTPAKVVAGGRDGTVRVWSAGQWQAMPEVFVGHDDQVLSLTPVFTPYDGVLFASGGGDGRIGLTKLPTALRDGANAHTGEPATGADRPGAITGDESPAASAVTSNFATPILQDGPTRVDALGRRILAEDLDQRLSNMLRDQQLPVAVHLQGPWGSGKSSLVEMLEQSSLERYWKGLHQAPWSIVHYDAWREAAVGPVWWGLARAMRSGVADSRSQAFRLIFRPLEAVKRASQSPARLTLVVVLAILAASIGPDFGLTIGTLEPIWGNLALVVPVLLLADKFLFWDSSAGARLHMRTDNNPLEDVARHVTWLRRRSGRVRLDSVSALPARILALAGTVLLARALAWSLPYVNFPGASRWVASAVFLIVVFLGPFELYARSREARRKLMPDDQHKAQTYPRDNNVESGNIAPPIALWALVLFAGFVAVLSAIVPIQGRTRWWAGALLTLGVVAYSLPQIREWLAEPKRPILFVIDDLDRCGHETTVQILESVQTLMRRRRTFERWDVQAPLTFLVLADSRWLRTAFETRFAPFVPQVAEPGKPLGYLFLDKLFQLSVSIPSAPTSLYQTWLDSLLLPEAGSCESSPPSEVLPDSSNVDQVDYVVSLHTGLSAKNKRTIQVGKSTIGSHGEDRLRREIGSAQGPAELYSPAIQEAVLRLPPQSRLEVKSTQVRRSHELQENIERHILTEYLPLMPENPRAVKRCINTFGVNSTIAFVVLGNVGTKEAIDQVVRWTILSVRWPELAEHLRRNADVLVRRSDASSTIENSGAHYASDEQFGGEAALSLLGHVEVQGVLFGGIRPLDPQSIRQLIGSGSAGHASLVNDT